MLLEVISEMKLKSLVPLTIVCILPQLLRGVSRALPPSAKHIHEVQRKNNDLCHVNSTQKSKGYIYILTGF